VPSKKWHGAQSGRNLPVAGFAAARTGESREWWTVKSGNTNLLCALSLSGQSRKQRAGFRKQSPAGHSNPVPAKNQANTQDPGYVIGPDDLLDIRVFKEDPFTELRAGAPDGKISVPL
jgi:hypothetical protein